MAIAVPESSGQNRMYRCQGGHDEQAVGVGRTVGAGRADPAQASVRAGGRQTACTRSRLPHGHFVRAQDRHSLGVFPARDGLLRHDPVEPPGRMAPSRRLGPTPPPAVEPTACRRADRLLSRGRGFIVCPCGARREKTGPSPVDRRKNGSKHHMVVDASGIPLATTLTGANRHDVTQLIPLIDAIGPIGGKVGAPLRKPEEVMGDRGYDSEAHRTELSCRAIPTLIARRNTPHGSGLGVFRWVVEQALALFHQFRRLRTRFDKRDDIHEAFMTIGCAMMCWRRLHSSIGHF